MLPYGYETDGGGLFRNSVDQFDLLPAATDKSFSREALVADLQALSGGFSQRSFQCELNGITIFWAYSCTANPLTRSGGTSWIQLRGLRLEG